ncbi:MAG: hypothetical protein H6831_01630 [Planctomycetes bacterium]|nr:hypothetical protein [Planctomycetota bacterium]MCB9903086.1 hypothetical protein [Planctomycetota bacterium]
MNRSIALFVALAVLVAHAFAIHSDPSGDLAAPGEMAYAAFRVARKIAYEGNWGWNFGTHAADAYPSTLWVWICAVSERLYWPTHLFAAAVGLGASLLTMIVSSRFHQDRIASLIAPLLLAISGGFAAAAVSGTEWPLFMLFVITAFASLEKDYHRLLALALVLAGWTRPEGWLIAAALFVMQLVRKKREGRGAFWPFGVALLGAVALTLVRRAFGGSLVSPTLAHLFEHDPSRWSDGLSDLLGFAAVSASPLLVCFAAWYLLRGRLSDTGRRALELAALWCVVAVAAGGGRDSFHRAFLPALPLALIAAQEGMICALNSPRQWVRSTAWTAFVAAVLLAGLGSRSSGDLGPVPLERWRAALDEHTTGAGTYGFADGLGRAGLDEEMGTSALLRAVGVYLRDQTEPHVTIGSPWPGSIAYLSHRDVWDLLGRATPTAEGAALQSWSGRPRVDLAAELGRRPDYLVPRSSLARRVPSPDELAEEWLREMDADPSNPASIAAVRAALDDYELITVPVRIALGRTAPSRRDPVHLLRARNLGLRPELRVELFDGELRVNLRHEGSEQLAHLRVLIEDAEGNSRALNPRGGIEKQLKVFARTNLLLYPTEDREVLAFSARLGAVTKDVARVRAVLLNPHAAGGSAYDFVSEEAVLELP